MAQQEFVYDSSSDGQTTFLQAHSSTVRQHDSANYGTGFTYRGNLTKVKRYSVTNGIAGSPLETRTGYYTTGSVALAQDGLSHQTTFYYDDQFLHYTESGGSLSSTSVAPSPATWAYPTRVRDADGYSSTVSYNYDFGAATRTVDPKEYAVHGTSPTTMGVSTYDPKGRLDKSLVWQNGVKYAQTRYVYGTDHSWLQQWTTVNDLNEETYVLHLLDGVSRERITISEHPGSAGGLRASYKVFDLVGRVSESSNPTEIYGQAGCGQAGQPGCWATWGDDVTGYKYSTQTYDWKGRPLVTTNQDTTTKIISYEGCGCAGGQMVEYQSEEVPHDGTTGRRKGREYYDSFGRISKTELLDWNGNKYSSTTTAYNVRDQVTFGRAYQGEATAGTCPTGTCRETKLEYDGYGRQWRRWLPLYQPLPTDQAVTNQYDEYEYFANDTTQKMTDPRGAARTYGYNNRNLVTSVTYTVPGGVDPTPDVSFGYDAAGNRLWMDDGPGRVDYQYDALLQVQWEKRRFDDLTPDYLLQYEYNLAGQVRKVTDPWNASISYAYDKTGEVTAMTGNGYADLNQWTNRAVTNFATGIKYRAWGDLKEFTNGNFATDKAGFSLQYDARLQLTRFAGSGRLTEQDYSADSRVKEVRAPNHTDYQRTYNYDHAGRLTTANAIKTPTAPNDPYTFTYGYNAWGNTTARSGTRWNNALPNFTATWTNGRNTNSTHDAAGNQTASTPGATTQTQRYDATGRPSSNSVATAVFAVNNDALSYDGDGQAVRQVTEARIGTAPYSTARRHYVRASVLGGVIISEVLDKGSILGSNPNRFENQSNIYLNGERIAYQKYTDRTGPDKEVVWVYKHPVIGSLLESNQLNYDFQGQVQPLELSQAIVYTDPLGADLGYDPATLPPPVQIDDPLGQLRFGDITDYSSGCVMDGVRTNCNIVQSALNRGGG